LEFLAETLHPAVDVLGHGFFRETELHGGVTVGKALEFAEDHELALALRKGVERFGEECDTFAGDDPVPDIVAFIYDVQPGEISYLLQRSPAVAPHEIERDIAGDAKQKSARRLDRLGGGGPPDAEVGFLHDVVDVAHGGKRSA